MRQRKSLPGLMILLAVLTVFLCSCGESILSPSGAIPTAPPVPTGTPKLSYNADILPQIPDATAAPASPVDQPFLVAVAGAQLRSEPSFDEENILEMLTAGERVICLEENGDYLKIRRENGEEGWCHAWYLDAEDPALDAERDARLRSSLYERESFIALAENPTYYCIASSLNCRAAPDASSALLYRVYAGDALRLCGIDGDFYLVQLDNGRLCYCSVNWLSSSDSFAVCPGGVDLRVYIPMARFHLLYASSENFAREAFYPAIPLLEKETASKLLEASRLFWRDGYGLVIYDAYRPTSVQSTLYALVQDTRFIQNPANGLSYHQRGRAVDISLFDLKTGEELEMPTAVHSFTTQATRTNQALWTKTAEKNVDYLTRIMRSVGFDPNMTEWWHFEYTEDGGNLTPDLDLNALQILPVSQYESPY